MLVYSHFGFGEAFQDNSNGAAFLKQACSEGGICLYHDWFSVVIGGQWSLNGLSDYCFDYLKVLWMEYPNGRNSASAGGLLWWFHGGTCVV